MKRSPSNMSLMLTKEMMYLQQRPNIQSLPSEMLMHIFSYLPQASLGSVSMVCGRWKDIRYDASLYKVLNFSYPERQTVDYIIATLRRAPRLKVLTLSRQMQTNTILEVVCSCKQLRALVIENCRGSLERDPLSALVLKKLLVKCPFLQVLHIKHCHGISQGFLTQLGPRLPHLTSISVHVKQNLGTTVLSSLARNCPYLKNLQVSCIFDDMLNGRTFNEDLEILCNRVGGSLNTLRLNCAFWTYEGYFILGKCTQINNLALRYALQLREEHLTTLTCLPNLRTLDITMNDSIPGSAWSRLLNSPALKNLRFLSLVYTDLTDEVGLAIGNNLHNLSRLRLVGTKNLIKPSTYDSIVKNCSYLESIEIVFEGEEINHHCLLLIPVYLPKLRQLMITPVSDDALCQIQGQMDNLLILEDRNSIWSELMTVFRYHRQAILELMMD